LTSFIGYCSIAGAILGSAEKQSMAWISFEPIALQ